MKDRLRRLHRHRPLRMATAALAAWSGLAVGGCSGPEEAHRVVETPTVAVLGTDYYGPRYRTALGAVQNRSAYMNGLFADGRDRLAIQLRQILMSHLTQSGRFDMLDRENLEFLRGEADMANTATAFEGAEVVLTGSVSEFGRKEVGTVALGGLGGRSKTQVAYSKVSLTVVDVTSARAVFSVQGAGEYTLTQEHILGFGSEASYDSTLNDKVLNLAVVDAVNKLIAGLERGEWSP